MNKTKIEWVQNPDGTQGYTWNPITGCLNHVNGLCKGGGFPCYAYRLANGRLRERYLENDNIIWPQGDTSPEKSYGDPFYPRFWPERLYHPWGGEPKGIFVCDMGELFGDWVPQEWVEKVMNLIRKHKENRYYLLTKQPQNLPKWSPFPDNCWVGVTACNELMFQEAAEFLLSVKASIKYISFEPLLEWANKDFLYSTEQLFKAASIKWVIIGAQTKPYKPPKIEWVQEIIESTKQAKIPYFLKDNLAPILPDDKLYWKLGYENGHFTDARPRQEMPNA